MNEATIGVLILLTISTIVAAVTHWFCPRFLIACLGAAIIATVLFQIATYLIDGHLDKFVAIAVVVSGSIAFGIALVVGGVVRLIRPRRQSKANRDDKESSEDEEEQRF
jgi:predicted phage tail protein